jgi:hypothetical protein
MKTGYNDFYVSVTNISGQTYAPTGGAWTVNSYVAGISGTGNVYELPYFGEYRVNLYTGKGNGVAYISNSDPKAVLNPTKVTWETTDYSLDDVAALVANYRTSLLAAPPSDFSYDPISFTTKEGDSLYINYTVPSEIEPDLSGYSDFKASLRSEVATISSNSGYLGELVVIPNLSTATFIISGSGLTTGIIPYPRRSVKVYSDLQGTKAGLVKTLAEFVITVNRQYTV